jgi:hypothetical protein
LILISSAARAAKTAKKEAGESMTYYAVKKVFNISKWETESISVLVIEAETMPKHSVIIISPYMESVNYFETRKTAGMFKKLQQERGARKK